MRKNRVLKEIYMSCNLLAESAAKDGEAEKAKTLKAVIRKQVYPILKSIIRLKNAKQHIEQKVDPIPAKLKPAEFGNAHNVGATAADQTNKLRKAVREAVTLQLTSSEEFANVQAAQNEPASKFLTLRLQTVFYSNFSQNWAKLWEMESLKEID